MKSGHRNVRISLAPLCALPSACPQLLARLRGREQLKGRRKKLERTGANPGSPPRRSPNPRPRRRASHCHGRKASSRCDKEDENDECISVLCDGLTTLACGCGQGQLEEEHQELAGELGPLVEGVREAEGKMAEVSALSEALSGHIQRQTEQIEALYKEAVEATGNVSKASRELGKALDRGRGRSRYIAFFFLVSLSALLLLVDSLSA